MGIQQERKTLDGIKPVATTSKPYQWTAPSTSATAVARPKPRTLASVKAKPQPHPRHPNAAPKAQSKMHSPNNQRPKPPKSARRTIDWMLTLHIAAAVTIFAALCFFSEKAASTGQLIILAYAVYALALRTPSRITFMLVLASFAAVILHLTVRPDTELVNTFSIYAFLLLIVSAISLGKEGRRQVRFE